MPILNTYLNNVAAAMAEETYDVASYLAVSTSTAVTNIALTDTTIGTEQGTRGAFTKTRTNNLLELSSIRTGAVITDPTGEEIKVVGAFTAQTGGDLFIANIASGLIQTTNFDVQFVYSTLFDRQ